MNDHYDASAIEVLSGLDPVRRRPGMYTDVTRPNHLAQEVIDNGVDEAIAGYADALEVILHGDGSLTVTDNGRGMPVDIHPEEGIPGVELILTRLHAGGKFSSRTYRFSGGLHGVGVSVVNALSTRLEVWVRRGGQIYHTVYRDGDKDSELQVIGTVGQRQTGTTLRFWPDPKYFETPASRSPASSTVCAPRPYCVPASRSVSTTRPPTNVRIGAIRVGWAIIWGNSWE